MSILLTTVAGMSWLLSCAMKAALMLAASWVGARLMRRGSAAARHQMWTLGVVGALAVPLLCWIVSTHSPHIATLDGRGVSIGGGSIGGPALSVAPVTWPVWIACVWAVGALVVGMRFARGHLAARRLLLAASPNVSEVWSPTLREVTAALRMSTRVRLLRSETVASPMTVGVLRPTVVLPAGADMWSAPRLRAVLVHELGHVRRLDTLVQVTAQLACALYWWNPLAWLAAAQLRLEREHACDDLVLSTGGHTASSYAADLLDVARAVASPTPMWTIATRPGAICMVDPSGAESRILRVLDASVPRAPLATRLRFGMPSLALAGLVLFACTSPAPPRAHVRSATRGTLSVGAPIPRGWDMLNPPADVGWDMVHTPVQQGGTIDMALVATELNGRLGDLEDCYARRLAVAPALSGTVVVHWTIGKSGEVVEQCITEDGVGDSAIVACVNDLVRQARFTPPSGGTVSVAFPFVFTPPRAVATRE